MSDPLYAIQERLERLSPVCDREILNDHNFNLSLLDPLRKHGVLLDLFGSRRRPDGSSNVPSVLKEEESGVGGDVAVYTGYSDDRSGHVGAIGCKGKRT